MNRNDPNLAVDRSDAFVRYGNGRALGRNCANGWKTGAALETVKTTGFVDEACSPYVAGDQNCTGRCGNRSSRLYTVVNHHAITAPPAMKEWISTVGPLTACCVVYNDLAACTRGVYRHVAGAQAGGHCVTLIGDDAQGCWIAQNSRDPGWGDQGCFRIAFGAHGIDPATGAVLSDARRAAGRERPEQGPRPPPTMSEGCGDHPGPLAAPDGDCRAQAG